MPIRLLSLLLFFATFAHAATPKVCEDLLNPRSRSRELYRLYQLKLNDQPQVAAVMGVDETILEALIGGGELKPVVPLQFASLKYLSRTEAIARARCDARAQSIYATVQRHLGTRKVTEEGHILLYVLSHMIAEFVPYDPVATRFTVPPEILYGLAKKLKVTGISGRARLHYFTANLGLPNAAKANDPSDDAFIFEHLFTNLPANSGFIVGLKPSAVVGLQDQTYPVLPRLAIEDLSGLRGINPTNNGSLELILVHQ